MGLRGASGNMNNASASTNRTRGTMSRNSDATMRGRSLFRIQASGAAGCPGDPPLDRGAADRYIFLLALTIDEC